MSSVEDQEIQRQLLKDLREEVRDLRSEMQKIKADTNVMVHHVWFVNSVYERLREPINSVLNAVARVGKLFVEDYEEKMFLGPMNRDQFLSSET